MIEKPKFNLVPRDDGYLGSWDLGHKKIEILFKNGNDAFDLNSVVTQAWDAGVESGMRRVALKVYRTVEDFNVI